MRVSTLVLSFIGKLMTGLPNKSKKSPSKVNTSHKTLYSPLERTWISPKKLKKINKIEPKYPQIHYNTIRSQFKTKALIKSTVTWARTKKIKSEAN